MRSLLPLVLILTSAAGCATGPKSFLANTPDPQDGAYTCALREMNRLGYTVRDADRDAGFVTGQKQTSGLGTALLTGKNFHDVLTVSIFDSGDSDERTIRVTAAQMQENAIAFGSASQTGTSPSSSGKADAQTILMNCAQGTISEQALGEFEAATITASQ